jgi:hypothetical protein
VVHQPSSFTFGKGEDGIYGVPESHKQSPESLYRAFPLAVGTTWTSARPEGQIISGVESVEAIELPNLKCRDCLKISVGGRIREGRKEISTTGRVELGR